MPRFYNKTRKSKHEPALPLYTFEEAQDCLQYFKPVAVGQTIQLIPELSFRFVHAAHILGSCMAEVSLDARRADTRACFSPATSAACATSKSRPARSCIPGRRKAKLADVLVMESTYGNRHASRKRSAAGTGRADSRHGGARRQRDRSGVRRRAHAEIRLHAEASDGVGRRFRACPSSATARWRSRRSRFS